METKRIVITEYVQQEEIDVVTKEYKDVKIIYNDGKFPMLMLGNKEVYNYKYYCDRPDSQLLGHIPQKYVIRVYDGNNWLYKGAFDLIDDGKFYCNLIYKDYIKYEEGQEKEIYDDIYSVIEYINKILENKDWEFFVEEPGI